MSDTTSISSAVGERRTISTSPATQADARAQSARPPAAAVGTLTVLLVGNYRIDQQQSMQLFAEVLARELPKYDPTVHVEVIRPEPWFGQVKPDAEGLGKWLGYLDKFVVFPWRLRRKIAALKRTGANFLVHLCDHSSAPYSRYLRDVPHLVSCHDLLAIRSALGEIPTSRPGWTGRAYQWLILRGLQRAAHVVCISEQTRTELLRISGLPPQRTAVIPMGLNLPYSPTPLPERRDRLAKLLGDPETRYLLHLGGNQWYKNRMGLLKIYAALRKTGAATPKLVLAGKPFCPEMHAFLQSHPEIAGNVIPVIDVAAEDLRALYSGAELLLFPSLAEGFGWPIIEAQACGCRVAASDRAPLTEVGGEAAIYLDPEHPAAAALVVRSLLTESRADSRQRIRQGFENAERFSTGRMIRGYLAAYRSLLP
ncbi:MAG: hypothetical protein QOE70_6441 [Chthoniobacter sp.]|jgi:glycosyltransferase involved in cell wall biosynthesis|nr:hypothetical protein [Chthoniobacter sp.]